MLPNERSKCNGHKSKESVPSQGGHTYNSTTSHDGIGCGPLNENQPGYIVLRHPEQRLRDPLETRAIQEGAEVNYCQAHLDPPDQDGLESMVRVGVDDIVGNGSRPLVPQATVDENGAQGQYLPGGYAFASGQAPVIPVAASASAVAVHPDQIFNSGLHIPSNLHMQSVSGFSDVRMMVPTHVRPLSDHDLLFPPRCQDLENTQNEEQARRTQPRPEFSEGFESERTTMPSNGPINPSESRVSASSPYFTAAQQQPRETVTSSAQTVHDAGRPRHPQYSDQQARNESFRNWPGGLRPSPQSLTKAGCYYTGIKDQCCCFQCGVTLRRWQPDDDPIEEHAKWSPDCPFVRKIKGNRCQVTKEAQAVEAAQHRMQNLSVNETVPKKFQDVEAMGFKTEEIMQVLKTVGENANVELVVNILLKKNQSDASCNRQDLPPHMDPNICAVCRKNPISVTQLECRHIVCRKCFSKDPYRCGVCKREVTGTVAYDSAAFST